MASYVKLDPSSFPPPSSASSSSPPKAVEFAVDAKCHELALRCQPFGGEPFQIRSWGLNQALVWSSKGRMAVLDRAGGVLREMVLPKGKTISKVIVTGNQSFIVLGENNRVYWFDWDASKFTDITQVKSALLPPTVTAVVDGVAWASKERSIVIVDGERGERIFRAKLPKALKKEQVTAIASVGTDIIVAGTSHGHVVVYDRHHVDQNGYNIVMQFHQVTEERGESRISRLAAEDTRYLALELDDRVVVLENFLEEDPAVHVKLGGSLMPYGRSFQDAYLLMRYKSSNSPHLPPFEVWNLLEKTSYSLKEPKFWPDSYAEFTVDGQIVGGGGSHWRPLRLWDASTGNCLAETPAVQISNKMDQGSLGFVLAAASDEGVGLVDVAQNRVTLFGTPSKVKVVDFARLADETIVVTGNDGGFYTFFDEPGGQ